MVYTLMVTVWRLGTLLGAALYFRDVEMIFVTIVCAEALKNVADLCCGCVRAACWCSAGTRGLPRTDPAGGAARARLDPNKANDFGSVVVGMQLGPVPMAIYTTAAYQVPLVNIVQTSLSDVIFPDMVKRAQRDPAEGLRLWKRAQMTGVRGDLSRVAAAELLRRAADSSGVHRRSFRPRLTSRCSCSSWCGSVPVLHAAARRRGQCFVRARSNASRSASMSVILLALMPRFGLWGPTLGLVVGQLWTAWYLGRRVMTGTRLPLAEIFQWRKFGLSMAARCSRWPSCTHADRDAATASSSMFVGLGVFAAVLRDRRALHPARGIRLRHARLHPAAAGPECAGTASSSVLVRAEPGGGRQALQLPGARIRTPGYDVHVITHETRDWSDWKTDARCRSPGRCIAARKS